MAFRGRKSAATIMPFPEYAGSDRDPLETPAHFAPEERKLWDRITDEIDINSTAAEAILITALEAHARARACREQIKKDGLLIRTRHGSMAPLA